MGHHGRVKGQETVSYGATCPRELVYSREVKIMGQLYGDTSIVSHKSKSFDT